MTAPSGIVRLVLQEGKSMVIKPYVHKVQYYETDQMGVVHHSNYIRWFEEARTDILEQAGLPYAKMEEMGVISPVLGVDCEYKSMVRYGQSVQIYVHAESYDGIRMTLAYSIKDENGQETTWGHSKHCFIDKDGKLLSLKRKKPEVHAVFEALKEISYESL